MIENGVWFFLSSLGVLAFVWLAILVLWVWSIVDVIRSDFKDKLTKAIWVGLLIFLPVVGSLIYLFVGKSTKTMTQE